jgi:hypothetical protein
MKGEEMDWIDTLFVRTDATLDTMRLRFWQKVLELNSEFRKVAVECGNRVVRDLEVDQDRLRKSGA